MYIQPALYNSEAPTHEMNGSTKKVFYVLMLSSIIRSTDRR